MTGEAYRRGYRVFRLGVWLAVGGLAVFPWWLPESRSLYWLPFDVIEACAWLLIACGLLMGEDADDAR